MSPRKNSTINTETAMSASSSKLPSPSSPAAAEARTLTASASSLAPAAPLTPPRTPTASSPAVRQTTSSSFPAASPQLSSSYCTTETVHGTHLFQVNQMRYLRNFPVGKHVRSGKFVVDGHTWAIVFFPSGSEAGPEEHASVYLELVASSAKEVRVLFDLRLVNQITGRSISLFGGEDAAKAKRYAVFSPAANAKLPFHHPPRCWGVASFNRSGIEVPAYVQGDSLSIRCHISVVREPRTSLTRQLPHFHVPAAPAPSLSSDLGKLLEEREEKDVTVLVQGEAFPAHRAVLAARSPVLKEKLRNKETGKLPASIAIDGIKTCVFKAMLQFIYTDMLPSGLEDRDEEDKIEMVKELFVAAEGCAIERLKRVCESLLCNSLSKRTLKTTRDFAEQHGCDMLIRACFDFESVCYPLGPPCIDNLDQQACKRIKRS